MLTFFLPLLPFPLLYQMLNCSNFKTQLAQVLAKKDHAKHQHAKNVDPKKGPQERPVFLHNSTSGQAVTLKCYSDQKYINTKWPWSGPNYQKYMNVHVHRNDCYFKICANCCPVLFIIEAILHNPWNSDYHAL